MNIKQNQPSTIIELETIQLKDIIGVSIMHFILLILSLSLIFWLIYKTDQNALLSQKIKHFFYFISQYFLLPFLFLYLLINLSILGISYLFCKNVHYITMKDVVSCSQKIICCKMEKCRECLSNWFCLVCRSHKKENIQTIKVESKNNAVKSKDKDKEDTINNKSNEQIMNNNKDNLQIKFERTFNAKENEASSIIRNNNSPHKDNEIKEHAIEIINQSPNLIESNSTNNNNAMIRPPVKKPVNKSKIMEFLEGALVNDNNNPVFVNFISIVKENIATKKKNQNKESQCNQTNILGKY